MRLMLAGIFLSFGLFLFNTAEAATLYMDPSSAAINRGDSITVKVRLDTDEGECVNVVDGTITYSENIVAVDTSRGSSILSVWLEDPVIDSANRTITFAGGIPNGYCGRIIGDPRLTNQVIELVFSAPGLQIGSTESGNVASIAFGDETRVLMNDGLGTDAPLRLFDAKIEMSKTPGNTIANDWLEVVNADNTPPQEFTISLEKNRNAFSNKYFIVFNTTDKQSGIDYYEVMEEPLEEQNLFRWGAADAPWLRARSPYVLKDQSLNSTIRVRAYDKAGNDYIAVLVPEESQRRMTRESKIMIALVVTGLLVFVAAGAVFTFMLRRRRARKDDEEVEYEIVEEYEDEVEDAEGEDELEEESEVDDEEYYEDEAEEDEK